MKKNAFAFLFLSFIFISCGQSIKLSDEDYNWMPYTGNETLVFKSNTGETDTIYFIRKDTVWGMPDPAVSTNKYEIVGIFCRHSDGYTGSEKFRYLENYFLEIKKNMNKRAELVFGLATKNAKFYRLSSVKIDSLSKVSPTSVTVSNNHYGDVYIIEAEDYLGSLSSRSDYVTKLYWSKSKGLIRYDKQDSSYWELGNEY
ncbi:MAG TPA: hypothetical protein VHN59_11815 [Chitinophagaceae bacterium]|nr:hypothetical protein [Chitinophagaceae bacterium]